MSKIREVASQVGQRHFPDERQKETDAMREIRQLKEHEVKKIERLRALRLAKEDADKAAGELEKPKPERKARTAARRKAKV